MTHTSTGKGDNRRPEDKKKLEENWDKIKWDSNDTIEDVVKAIKKIKKT